MLHKIATVYIDKLEGLPPGQIHAVTADENKIYRAVWRKYTGTELSKYEIERIAYVGVNPVQWTHITWENDADAAIVTLMRLCENSL